MTFTKAVVYLEKDNFYYYDANLSTVLSFHFGNEAVKDLEVLNSAALHLAIKSFIDNNKVTASQIMIVLSPNVYFEKEFPETSEFHADNELAKFVDTVPFENCSSQIYKIANVSKLVATNTDFYNAIKSAFEKAGFLVEAVAPLFVLGKDIAIGGSLDVTTAKIMLERYELAKQNSLLLHQEKASQSQNQKEGERGEKNDNKSLIFLLPILFTLIIILIIIYLKTSTP